jgi:hypothetical protein
MPEQPSGVDRVRSLVSAYAQECLADLSRAGCVPRADAAVKAGAGWTVLLVAFPTPPGDHEPRLTASDRDCLGYLASACEPLSAARVRRELEKKGLAIHAEITVKRSLARLKRLGLVTHFAPCLPH